MELILPYSIKSLEQQILHSDKLLMIGSCFSENIGAKLAENKWDILVNPTGNLFNPVSIFKTLSGKLNPELLVEKGDQFSNWDVHGDLTFASPKEITAQIQAKNNQIATWTKESNWIIVTLGTAYVYELIETGAIVANCHKVPQSKFRKRLLSELEIVESFMNVYEELKKQNPNAKWLFTVSPVKHLKDGLTENHISKGILLQAIHQMTTSFPNVYYFPAYELVTDVLRDYRFYENDFAHPNDLAIQYIWERFLESVVSEDGRRFILRWKHIKQALLHRPLLPASKEHQLFLKWIITDLTAFSDEVDTSMELQHFQKQLIG